MHMGVRNLVTWPMYKEITNLKKKKRKKKKRKRLTVFFFFKWCDFNKIPIQMNNHDVSIIETLHSLQIKSLKYI